METSNIELVGLSESEVKVARNMFGTNTMDDEEGHSYWEAAKEIFKEPMVLLLLVASSLYFFSGHIGDGIFLAIAIVIIGAISIFQNNRSRNALDQLRKLAQPISKVIRGGQTIEIKSDQIVVGDLLVVEEGSTVNADADIIRSNDFSVDEAILTGESLPVFKNISQGLDEPVQQSLQIFAGTAVVSGLAVARVTAIGNQTEIGRIGGKMKEISQEKSPLEIQVSSFVKKMIVIGVLVFVIVWAFNFLNSNDILDSLLKALTLAMSILPEEIPVAFTTFMAMGAWRMAKKGVIVKQLRTVETLGSATVICVDKTGTITKNEMSIAGYYNWSTKQTITAEQPIPQPFDELLSVAMFASEPIAFDAMEIAIHEAYSQYCKIDQRPFFQMIHEYPLGGKPPMMTHIFENEKGQRIVACKGAPEAIISTSNLSDEEAVEIKSKVQELARKGYRILGVAKTQHQSNIFPDHQQDFKFHFLGLLAFYDPPKNNIKEVFDRFKMAGIKVKIITGDNEGTTAAIAEQIKFDGADKTMSGEELVGLSNSELKQKVEELSIFTRMFPEAKLRIINQLKDNNEVVAMTGDGVNDSLALKSAHIGIAMGKKGTEIAKASSDLVLIDDDLDKIVEAVAMGRKIYSNLKKAIRYIISIHIPIILVVFIPLILGWIYPNIFTPVHVILLELIMGPTCSIIYENEPMEAETMEKKPRNYLEPIFSGKELLTSIIQGLLITVGVLVIYRYAISLGATEDTTRTMVFTCLITANIVLTLVNRSFYYSIFKTLQYKNPLVPLIIGVTILMMMTMLWVKPVSDFFKFESVSFSLLLTSMGVGMLSVVWYELVKWRKRLR